MSILNPTAVVRPSRIESKVEGIEQSTKTIADKIIKTWENSFSAIWDDENPAAVLAELGTNAAEVFLLSSATVQFLSEILASSRPDDLGRILTKVENMPAFDVNEDGTITLS